jgi:hypothetical protein
MYMLTPVGMYVAFLRRWWCLNRRAVPPVDLIERYTTVELVEDDLRRMQELR